MKNETEDHKFIYHIYDDSDWITDVDLNSQDIEFDDQECSCDLDSDSNFIVGVESGKVWDFKALSTDIPEFQRRTCKGWTKIPFDGRVSYNYPCLYKRNCRKTFYIRVAYSGSDTSPDIEKAVKECAETAIKASLPLLVAGQFQAALAAIWSSFKICIATKVAEDVTKFSLGIHNKKRCDEWHKV